LNGHAATRETRLTTDQWEKLPEQIRVVAEVVSLEVFLQEKVRIERIANTKITNRFMVGKFKSNIWKDNKIT
jgi:hypothetical protein